MVQTGWLRLMPCSHCGATGEVFAMRPGTPPEAIHAWCQRCWLLHHDAVRVEALDATS